MGVEESERVLAEAKSIVLRRAERAAERDHPKKPVRPKPKPRAKQKLAPKARNHSKHGASRRNGRVAKKKR
jgi:hypothetical protein